MRRVADLQSPSVRRSDVADHGQPQPGAAGIATATLVEADEATDDVVTVGHRDAGPVVVDVDRHLLARIRLHRDVHGARPVPGGVGHEVIDGPAECLVVADDVEIGVGDAHLDGDPPAAGGHVVDHVGEHHLVVGHRPLVAAGEQQEIVDQARQAAELVEQHVTGGLPVRHRANG